MTLLAIKIRLDVDAAIPVVPAPESIGAGASIEEVVERIPVQDVVARVPVQLVVLGFPIDVVAAVSPVNDVSPRAAVQSP